MASSFFFRVLSVYQAALFVFLTSAFGAEPMRLNLEQAIQAALERNLELKAKKEELGVAEGRVIRADLFLQSNPELGGDVGNFKVTRGEPAFAKNQTNYGFSLNQEFEIGGQPRYRREAAQRNLEKVNFEVSDLERVIRFRISEFFLKLLNAQAKIKQAEQIVNFRSRLYEASKTRLSLGDIPEVQVIVAEFERNKAKSDLISFQREYEELLSRLRTELALERVDVVGDLTRQTSPLSFDELLKSALEK